jgi:protein SCO1
MKILKIIQISILALVAILFSFFMLNFSKKNEIRQEQTTEKTEKYIENFELTDQDNNVFSFDSLSKYYKLVYFGFTYCPDICPASLNKINNILKDLNRYKYSNFKMLFISVDPKRDTPEKLKLYLGHFNKDIIGLTSDDENKIKKVVDQFGAYYQVAPNEDEPENYMVNHTSFIYLIDKDGRYINHFHLDNKYEEIIDYVVKNKLK